MQWTWTCLSAIVVAGLIVGCETEKPSQIYLTITPREATISKGQSIEFAASGWNEYAWRLSDASLGYLSQNVGERTIYTSLRAGAASQVLTVSIVAQTVTSTGTNTTTTTATTTTVASADAYITHQ